MSEAKVTVQVFRGEETIGEYTATSKVKTVQEIVDWVFWNIKEEFGVRFLGHDGVIFPSCF